MRDDYDRTLYPNRWKLLGLLLVCAGFVAAGVFMGVKGGNWIGYACAAFFGLGIPLAVVQMLPGAAYLKLGPEGFESCSLFRRHTVRWRDIHDFGLMVQSTSGATTSKMVGWNYRADFDESKTARSLSRSMTGIEGALPDTYGLSAEDLLALMQNYWRRALEADADADVPRRSP